MLNANGHKNFTASGDLQAEKLLSGVLAQIAETLKGSGLSLYLGGSYGRGEGGVRQDRENGVLYNDLDFFVFAGEKSSGSEKLLHEIAEKYENILKVDVDFSHVMSVKKIRKNARRLMMQELKRGNRLVCGEDLLAMHLPEIPAEKLPFSEACRLLLNRGMGLLFAEEKIAASADEYDFILRNIYKAILGSGDARMIAAGKYRWRITERLEAIQVADLPDKWKKLYAEAAAFKSSPHRCVPENLPEFLHEAKEFFMASVLAVADVESMSELPCGIWHKCHQTGETDLINCLKYCIKTRSLGNMKYLTMPPTAVVLCNLCCKTTSRDDLYKQWLKFN